MQAFVCTKFHVVPKKGTLAYLCDVITRILRAFVGGKPAEKITVTYHFVIWSMYAFVSTRFHVVPRKGMLAVLLGVFGPHYYCLTHSICPGRNHFLLMVFDYQVYQHEKSCKYEVARFANERLFE